MLIEPSSLTELRAARDEPALHEALLRHFAFLLDSPGMEPVARAVFAQAHAVEVHDGALVVRFLNGDELTCAPPADSVQNYQAWPTSFQAIVKHHERLSFPDDDWAIHLGDHGGFDSEYLKEEESELLEAADDAAEVLSPLAVYSDWWLYHPRERNATGEPALCYVSHEGGEAAPPVTLNVGAQFLLSMAQTLELEVSG